MKKSILVLGAGRSSSALISYLLNNAESEGWHVVVGDYYKQSAIERVGSSGHGNAIQFNIEQTEIAAKAVEGADIVISLLPADFHPRVAKLCLHHNKHLFTASYISNEMQSFHQEALNKNLLFMNECGLDPGVDHMSAMEIIDRIKAKGGSILSFESFTGGLIAPDTDPDNPWRYKFTWNPRNVVMAGQGTAKFIQEGQYKFIPYQQLFTRTTSVHIPDFGDFEGYANRDSLKYINTYGLAGVKTMLRGTLRNEGFCSAWNILV
jgi:saccharopine dehydrogenase (NADP+, L-glutamate forming)